MKKYEESISAHSVWITATPAPLARTLPFFISEAGHFIAEHDYRVQRDMHDSFLLLYTLNGEGAVQVGNASFTLPCDFAAIIDCHMPHQYHSASGRWEFLWAHFGGNCAAALLNLIYPNNSPRAICMKNTDGFQKDLDALIDLARQNDIAAYIRLSSQIHSTLNAVCLAALEDGRTAIRRDDVNDIQSVVKYIEANYSRPISVDDMIAEIHVSKYHFIRRFNRAMGIPPYSYLTNYRINISKTLLRSTDKTVAEIAEACGFLDTSNFIAHFKKHTGQKPLQYRRDFS